MRYLLLTLCALITFAGSALAAQIYDAFPYRYKYIPVEGSRMAYIEEGQGTPVLFLHGNPTNSYIWRNIIPAVSPHARAIALDLIGMGESDAPDIPYKFKDHIKYVDGFIKEMGLKDVIIVGQDWGSAIGLHYAMQNPDNVKGIVMMEAILKPFQSLRDFRPKFAANLSDMRDPIKGQQLLIKENFFIAQVLPGQTLRQLNPTEFDAYGKYFEDEQSRIPVWRFVNELPIAEHPKESHDLIADYSVKLSESDHPKLFFFARPGGLGNASQVEWAKDNLKNTTFVDIGPGIHHLQEENPHAIAAGLSVWIQNLVRDSAK